MAPKSGNKVIARLDDAIKYGWLHGKAWLTTKEQLDAKNAECVCELMDGECDWVCYAYLDPNALSEWPAIITEETPLTPSEKTARALKEAAEIKEGGARFESIDALMEDLKKD